MYEIKAPVLYPYKHSRFGAPFTGGSMQRAGIQRRTIFLIVVSVLVSILVYTHVFGSCDDRDKSKMYPKESTHYVYDDENKGYPYDRNMPLIFIGGVPRSGTTLMRAMLDAHPEVRCGEETRVIPRILGMRGQWAKSQKETTRLQEAGLSDDVIDDALAAFMLEVIAKHGEPAPRLCNKDPFTLKSSVYLAHLFPNSKFVLMIRDGRAVVHSIISRKVTISGFDLKNFSGCLKKWNSAMESMYYQCLRVGSSRCMPVFYEQLVLHPEKWMRDILAFLEIPWNDAVIHHEEFINKPGGISLSKTERSTDQVVKPVNVAALSAWVDHVPDDIRSNMAALAPMLDRLGYDPSAFPPNYGEPDKPVVENSLDVKNNADTWRRKSKDLYLQPKHPPYVAHNKVVPQTDSDKDTEHSKHKNNDNDKLESHSKDDLPNSQLGGPPDTDNGLYKYVEGKAVEDLYSNKGS